MNKNKYQKTVTNFFKNFGKRALYSLKNSILIAFFTNLFSEQSLSGKSGLVHVSRKKSAISDIILKFRLSFARSFENSILLKFAKNTYRNFLALPLRAIAVFMLTYGIILILTSAITKNNFDITLSLSSENFYIGIVILATSIIMLPTKKTLSSCIKKSKLLSGFSLNDIYTSGSTEDTSELKGYSSAFFFGVICAAASLVVSPADVLLLIVSAICTCAVFYKPETGIILLTALLPILSTGYIIYIVFITFVSFMLKYLRGKRHLNTRGIDILVFLASVLMLFSGIFTVGNTSGILHAVKLIFCFIVATLTTNLIRSSRTSLKCISMLISSAFSVALFNIVFFILQYTKISYEIAQHFSVTQILGILNIFSGKDELGIFSASMLPLIFSLVLNAEKDKKLRHILLFAMMFICVIISGSGVAFSVSIFSLIIVLAFKKPVYTTLVVPYLVFIRLLNSLPSLILNIFNVHFPADIMSDKQIIPQSTLELLSDYGVFGAGLGEENISSLLFGDFASSVSRQSTSAGNMLYQILLTLGIFGLLFVILFIISFLSVPFRYIRSDEYKDKNIQTVCVGLFSAGISFITLSLLSYTASDTRLIMFFMLLMGLAYSSVISSRNDHISEYVIREHLPQY